MPSVGFAPTLPPTITRTTTRPAGTGEFLLRLADDCEERARSPSCVGFSRSLFHRTAADARLYARSRLGGEELKSALAAAMATARLAACINGEEDECGEVQDHGAAASASDGPAAVPAGPSAEAMNARQLAVLFSKGERHARRAIERGARRGLPGFYREGCHLYAEPEEFERLWAVSELCPNSTAIVCSKA